MNTRGIEVVGTFQGLWAQWIGQVLAHLTRASVHPNPSPSEELGAILRAHPHSNFLVLVEHPVIGLAHALGRGNDIDPEAWLDDWLESARVLLAHAQRNSDATLVVNADAVRRRPRRLAQSLRSRWGDLFAAPSRITQDYHPDALTHALACGFVERDRALLEVLPELMGICAIVPGLHRDSARLMPEGIVDGAEAARRLAELITTELQLEQQARDRERERDSVRRELKAATDDCAQLRATVWALESGQDRMKARADALDRALVEAHSRLEAEGNARRILETQLEDAASRQESVAWELTAERENAIALGLQLDQLSAALAQAEEQRSETAQEMAQITDQLSKLEQELASTRYAARAAGEESTLVLRQLHQVEENLQRTILASRDTESAMLAAKEDLALATRQQATLERELAQVKEQRNAFEQDVALATKQRSTLEQELARVKEQRVLLEQQLVSAKETARAAGEESKLLLQQLQQVQEELERIFLAKRDAENAHLAVRTTVDSQKIEQDLRSTREECELLALQTRQVQDELERVHGEKVRLAQELKSRAALPGLSDISIGEVHVIGERDSPPHREVSFVVRNAWAGERQVVEATVRLVEHWGRPGLVIFADENSTPLIETWRESGREDDRPYMLLVHGEESAQRIYDAMGTPDWQMVQALVVRLGQALHDRAPDMSPAWHSLAQRLLTSLHEQPARLRYGNVVVTPIEREQQGNAGFELVLERASYHGRTWRRLPFQWQPIGPTPALELGTDEASGPPFLAWPTDADGLPVCTLRLPLGDDPEAPEIRAVWSMLSGSDRAFVAELLNLMPIFAVHLQSASLNAYAGARPIDLQAAAADTMLFGRAALQPPRGTGPQVERRRPLLKRMARRLGVTAKPHAAKPPAAEPALNR